MRYRAQALQVRAKAGIIGFTRALAREMGEHGITVNCIAPGPVDTDIVGGGRPASQRYSTTAVRPAFLPPAPSAVVGLPGVSGLEGPERLACAVLVQGGQGLGVGSNKPRVIH